MWCGVCCESRKVHATHRTELGRRAGLRSGSYALNLDVGVLVFFNDPAERLQAVGQYIWHGRVYLR